MSNVINKAIKSLGAASACALFALSLPSTAAAYDGNGAPPEEVESKISETETSYTGARILKAGTEIFGGTLLLVFTSTTSTKQRTWTDMDTGRVTPCSSVQRTLRLETQWTQ